MPASSSLSTGSSGLTCGECPAPSAVSVLANPPRATTSAANSATRSRSPVTTLWPGAVYTATCRSSGTSAALTPTTAMAPPPARPPRRRARVQMTLTASRTGSPPATTAAATSPME